MASIDALQRLHGVRMRFISDHGACVRRQVATAHLAGLKKCMERGIVAVRAEEPGRQSTRKTRAQVDPSPAPRLLFQSLADATRALRETPQQLALRLRAAAVYLALRQAYLATALPQLLVNTNQPHARDEDHMLLRATTPILAMSRPTTPVLERPASCVGLSRPSTPMLPGAWQAGKAAGGGEDPALLEEDDPDHLVDDARPGEGCHDNGPTLEELLAADGVTAIPSCYPHLAAAVTPTAAINLPCYLKCLPGFPVTLFAPSFSSSSSGASGPGRKLEPAYLHGKAPHVPIAHAPIPDVNRQQQVFPYLRKPDPTIQTPPASQEPIEACEGFMLPSMGVRVTPRVLHGTWDERPSVFVFADNTLYPSWSPLMHPSFGALVLYKRPALEVVRFQTYDELLHNIILTPDLFIKIIHILLGSINHHNGDTIYFKPLLSRKQLLLPAAGGSSASQSYNAVNCAKSLLLLPCAGGSSASQTYNAVNCAKPLLLLPAAGGSSVSQTYNTVNCAKPLLLLPCGGGSSASQTYNTVNCAKPLLLLPAAGGSSASASAAGATPARLALPPWGCSTASAGHLHLALVVNSRLQLRLLVLSAAGVPTMSPLIVINPAGPAAWPAPITSPLPASEDAGSSRPVPSLWDVRKPLALLPAAGASSASSSPCADADPDSIALVMVTPEGITTLASSQSLTGSNDINASCHNGGATTAVVVTCPDLLDHQVQPGGDTPTPPVCSPAVNMSFKQTIGRKKQQEDRVLLLECPAPHTSLMAVFDGHGGDRAAQWAKQEVPGLVEEYVAPHGSEGFAALCSAFDASYEETFPADLSGTTAALIYRTGAILHVANLGDSPIILINNSGGITPLYEKHNTISRAECARVREAGALVARPRGGCVDRIWDVAPEAGGRGTMVTRSLGDLAHKRVPGVIAVPWATSAALQPGHHVAAVALTDGITDCMSLDTVGRLVAEELSKGGPNAAFAAADAVVSAAVLAKVHDNASVAVMAFAW